MYETTLGPMLDEMRARGYRGPTGGARDGINVVIFHAPSGAPEPTWLKRDETAFGMPVVDCRLVCGHSLMFAYGDSAAELDRLQYAAAEPDENALNGRISTDPVKIRCSFGYPIGRPGRPPQGAHIVARQIEDAWNIYCWGNRFYFTRSWTGEVRYRATFSFTDHAMFMTEIEAFGPGAAAGETFLLRQVDYLVKAALFRLATPAPVPTSVSSDANAVAMYCLTEYGRIATCASFDDTTLHRLCLNGSIKTIVRNDDNDRILAVLSSVRDDSTHQMRRRLLDALGDCQILFAVNVPDPEDRTGPFTPDTRFTCAQRLWNGENCFFAYSDPAYCVEPLGLHIAFAGNALAGYLQLLNRKAGIVINPGGPMATFLAMADLEAMAGGVEGGEA